MKMKRYLGLFLLCLATSGCPFDVHYLSSAPTRFTREVESPKWFALKSEVLVTDAPCGYSRTLRSGSRWEQCGKIPEGEVYKSRDQSLTVECSHVYEAYLVVSEGQLNGFYLPVEKAYVSLPAKMDLPLR